VASTLHAIGSLATVGVETASVQRDIVGVTAKRLGLHPWRMIVERYAGDRCERAELT